MENLTRLNKFLSEAGICSRREADRLIESGKVMINGGIATLGMQVGDEDEVCIGGQIVTKTDDKVLLLFNKPRGIVCTAEKREKSNVIDYLNFSIRIYPIGRLDKDSEGLLLLTNQGDLVNKIMRAGNAHEKEYTVTVDKPITEEFLKNMQNGVPILDTVTRKCKVQQRDKHSFSIVLTQGLNRQIRRMCEYLGFKVMGLKRERIMNFELGNIKVGKYREATLEEWAKLYESIADSTSLSFKEQMGEENK